VTEEVRRTAEIMLSQGGVKPAPKIRLCAIPSSAACRLAHQACSVDDLVVARATLRLDHAMSVRIS
jgi:hypothetical protein